MKITAGANTASMNAVRTVNVANTGIMGMAEKEEAGKK
jgi:hypothetical protein